MHGTGSHGVPRRSTDAETASSHNGKGVRPAATCACAGASLYLTIAEAAEIARVSPKRLRNLMAEGVLREGEHFTRPKGLGPRVKREPFMRWLDGSCAVEDDIPLARTHRRIAPARVADV
jgi:hypothetical protein